MAYVSMLEGEADWPGEVWATGFRKCYWHYSGHHGADSCAGSCVEEARFKDIVHVGVAHEDHSSRSFKITMKHKHRT